MTPIAICYGRLVYMNININFNNVKQAENYEVVSLSTCGLEKGYMVIFFCVVCPNGACTA